MQKVPALLRCEEHNKRDYDPAVVSFGPYHHGKPELKLAEGFKPKALELFAAGSGKDANFFYDKVLDVIHDIRRCYVENSTDGYDIAVFARMMLHDACFIINHIHTTLKNEKEMQETATDHLGRLAVKFILCDMVLLENQVPFWFLKLLIYLKYGKPEGQAMLDNFLSITVFGEYKKTGKSDEEEEPLHLLEAFRRILAADCSNEDKTKKSWSTFAWLGRQRARIGKACQGHCILKCHWLWKREKDNHGRNMKNYIHSFRSVTDLKAKGIHSKPSPTYSLKDITFISSSFYGELRLPVWPVSMHTKVFFLNMVAFEMCPKTATDLTVCTYINFMKSLIESPQDVKELREKQIILNMLGSDREVLQVYNDINTFGVNNHYMFYELKKKVQEHYSSKAKTWRAELLHSYFRSPWTAIALFAAIFLLCLTFVQTYFTVHPTSN